MDKIEFAQIAQDVARTYLSYSSVEDGDRKRMFLYMSNLPNMDALIYTDDGFHTAADNYINKYRRPGEAISYNMEDFLKDENAPKISNNIIDFLYNTLTNTLVINTVRKQSTRDIGTMINICLHYLFEATYEGPRGAKNELVLNENDTENVNMFCAVYILYKPDYAGLIEEKTLELLDLNIDHAMAIAYAIRFRNYFMHPDISPGRNLEIEKKLNLDQLRIALGNGKDGNRQARGVLGYIESSYPEDSDQPELHLYMDEYLFGDIE